MADMMKMVYFDSEPFWGFLPMLDYLVGEIYVPNFLSCSWILALIDFYMHI